MRRTRLCGAHREDVGVDARVEFTCEHVRRREDGRQLRLDDAPRPADVVARLVADLLPVLERVAVLARGREMRGTVRRRSLMLSLFVLFVAWCGQ